MEELVNENTYINEVSWPLSAPGLPHHLTLGGYSAAPTPAASCLKQLAPQRAAGLQMGSCSVHHFRASASAGCCAADEVPRQLPAGPQGEACIRAGQVLPVHDAHPAAWRDSRQPAVPCHGYTGRSGVLGQIVESQAAPGVLSSKAAGGWLYTGALQMKQRDGSAWLTRCMPHLELSCS